MKLIKNIIILSVVTSSMLIGADANIHDIDTSKKAITVANVGSLDKDKKVEGNKIVFEKDFSKIKIVKDKPEAVESIKQEPIVQAVSKEIITQVDTTKSIRNSSRINIKNVRKQEKITIKKPTKPLIQLGGVKKYLPTMKEDKEGRKILIKSFDIKDAFNIKSDELKNLLKEYKNKEMTFSQVQNLASLITKKYRNMGYFVARAYIPVQKIEDGNLKIVVLEGQYGEFKLKNESLVKDSVVQGFLDNTKLDGTVRTASVDKASLERTMLLINDLPGVVISKANVKPGQVVGTSDFDVVSSTKANYDGYLLADNYGGYYTGEERLMGGVNFNSPFSAGDKLSLSGLISNGEDLINGSISYKRPINYSGLNAEISYSDTTYYLTEDLSSLEAQGNSRSVNLKFTYPFFRSRLENVYASLNLSHNEIEDETKSINDITEKTSNVATIGLDYDKSDVWFDIENQTKVSFSLTHGNLKFKNQDDEDDDALGDNTKGNFSKINFEISEDMYFTNKFSVDSSFSYQHSLGNKNLDGSEDFSVGGAYGVKLYPSGELNAENGYLFNIEAKYLMPSVYGVSNTIGVFYDIGRAYMADDSENATFEKRTLQDVGLGYYLSYKDFFANIQVAWTTDNEEITSEPNGNSRVLILGGMSF